MKKALCLIMVLAAMAVMTGCLTRASAHTKKTIYADGRVEFASDTSIVGTGDKASQVAGEGMFADGTEEDLGAGFKKGNASQQSTGIDGTLAGMGTLMTGMAKLMAASKGIDLAVPSETAPSPSVASDTSTDAIASTSTAEALPSESVIANAAKLAAKMAEAKSAGKPLVVLAGNTGCGYCSKLDKILDSDTNFLSRTDIVVYRETSPWKSNQAAKWTGGGNLPVLRVTEWDASGAIICDKKVNRLQTIADIEAAIKTCSSTQ